MTDTATDDTVERCMVCGAVGLPERIAHHDCGDSLTRRSGGDLA
jgi:hypothetical protein